MPRYALYGYWRSSSAWRVRIVLAWKGLPYDYRAVHLVRGGGEQHAEAYRAVNPMAQVPTLEIANDVGQVLARLGQSVAICEYLEEAHPAPPLLPAAPLDRARVRQLVEAVNAGIQPLQNLAVLQALRQRHGADDAAVQAWARDAIARGFTGLEALLAGTAGRHAFGDAVTLADAYLVPQLYNARRFGLDLVPFPRLLACEAAALALPAFQAAAPDLQPDAVW